MRAIFKNHRLVIVLTILVVLIPVACVSTKTEEEATLEILAEPDTIDSFTLDSEDAAPDNNNPYAGSFNEQPAYEPWRESQTSKPEGQATLVKVQSSKLNVRSGPSTKHGIVSTLRKGQKVRVMRQNNGWSQIGPGQYVRSNLLR